MQKEKFTELCRILAQSNEHELTGTILPIVKEHLITNKRQPQQRIRSTELCSCRLQLAISLKAAWCLILNY